MFNPYAARHAACWRCWLWDQGARTVPVRTAPASSMPLYSCSSRCPPSSPKVHAAGAISLPLYRYVEGTSFWDNVKKAAMAVGFAMRATGAYGRGGAAGRHLLRFGGGTATVVCQRNRRQAWPQAQTLPFLSCLPHRGQRKSTQGAYEQQAGVQLLMSSSATRPLLPRARPRLPHQGVGHSAEEPEDHPHVLHRGHPGYAGGCEAARHS